MAVALPSKLSGKVVVITGASSGLGRAAALELAHRGARVVVTARGAETLKDTAQKCREADASALIERQIEEFAPGFGELVLARSVMNSEALQRYNANYVGGDINGGSALLTQLFTRPVARIDPYSTPHPRLFLCSSSTPPGGGVHGMCGYWAASSALHRVFGKTAPPLP